MVERPITGFHLDDAGDWVAELGCGHVQHVRHRPPFQPRPWVVEEAGRRARLGTPLECRLCEHEERVPGLLTDETPHRVVPQPGLAIVATELERPDQGGEPACWLGEICEECGAFSGDGHHRSGCPADPRPTAGTQR